MTKKDINFNFEDIAIRSRESDGRVWFSVVDTIKVLLSYSSLKQAQVYWRKTKERLKAEGSQCVTECHQLKLVSSDGKEYKTDVASLENMFRIIQSIPSPKVESIKQRFAFYKRFYYKLTWSIYIDNTGSPLLLKKTGGLFVFSKEMLVIR